MQFEMFNSIQTKEIKKHEMRQFFFFSDSGRSHIMQSSSGSDRPRDPGGLGERPDRVGAGFRIALPVKGSQLRRTGFTSR